MKEARLKGAMGTVQGKHGERHAFAQEVLLAYLYLLQCTGECPACLSKAELAVATGYSIQAVERGLRILKRQGSLQVETVHLASGAQGANAYCLTPDGIEQARQLVSSELLNRWS